MPQPRLDFPKDIAETIEKCEIILSECLAEWFFGWHLFGIDIEKNIKIMFEEEKKYYDLLNVDTIEVEKTDTIPKNLKMVLQDDRDAQLESSITQNCKELDEFSKKGVDEFKTKIKNLYDNLKDYGNILAVQGKNLKGKSDGFDDLKSVIFQYAQLLDGSDFAKQRVFMTQKEDSNIYPIMTEVSLQGKIYFDEKTELPLLQCNFKINTEISIPKEELVYVDGPYNLGKDKPVDYIRCDINQHLAPSVGGSSPHGYIDFVVLKTLIKMTKEEPDKIFLIGPTLGGDSCQAYLPVVEFTLKNGSIEDYIQKKEKNTKGFCRCMEQL